MLRSANAPTPPRIGEPKAHYRMPVAGPVHIRFKNHQTVCNAVKTKDNEVLLGAIPMEDMDVALNPRAQTMEGEINPDSPYMPKMKLK